MLRFTGMRYWLPMVLSLVLLLPLTACAQPAGGTANPPRDSSAAPQVEMNLDTALAARLKATRLDADYDGVDFNKVLDDLRKRFDLNILVNWTALDAVGIARNKRTEIHLKQVTLDTMLNNVLAIIGGDDTELGFCPMNGIIVISTKEDLARRTIKRVYDVSDLLGSQYELRRFANTPILRLQLAGGETTGGAAVASIPPPQPKGGTGGGGSAGGGLFGGGGGVSRAPEPAAQAATFVDVDRIVELIETTVDPESWREAGGNIGSVRPFGGSLIVVQTASAHQEIDELLTLLRECRPASLDADAAIVRMLPADAAKWRAGVGAGFPRLTAEQGRAAMAAGQRVFHGTTSGHNGQRMWFSTLTQRMVIASYSPVLGDGVWGAAPDVVAVNEGLELIALPLVAPDDGSLALDVQMAWAAPAEVQTHEVTLGPSVGIIVGGGDSAKAGAVAGASRAATATVELATRRMRTVSTSVRLKLGEAIALSIPGAADANGAKADEDWLIIHVRKPGT